MTPESYDAITNGMTTRELIQFECNRCGATETCPDGEEENELPEGWWQIGVATTAMHFCVACAKSFREWMAAGRPPPKRIK